MPIHADDISMLERGCRNRLDRPGCRCQKSGSASRFLSAMRQTREERGAASGARFQQAFARFADEFRRREVVPGCCAGPVCIDTQKHVPPRGRSSPRR